MACIVSACTALRVTVQANSLTLPAMSDSALLTATRTPASASNIGRASAFVRIGLLFYGLLVVYASWYPLSGWRDNGLAPWAFLAEHMPRYWTAFDLAVNVAGYVPLGALTVLALYPLLRGAIEIEEFALHPILQA